MKRQSTEQVNIFAICIFKKYLKNCYKSVTKSNNQLKMDKAWTDTTKDIQMTNMQKTRCFVLFVFGERDFKPTIGYQR